MLGHFVFVFVLKWTVGVMSKGHLSLYTLTQELKPVYINPFFLELVLSLDLDLPLSLYSSSPYDRRHRPLYGDFSYEGYGMMLG